MTIFTRTLQARQESIHKEQSRQQVVQLLGAKDKWKALGNALIDNDAYAPSDSKKYLTLSEFGIREEDVIPIDDATHDLETHLKELFSEPMLGFDTESVVGLTKLEQETDGLATIQVATPKRVYIFDALRIKSEAIRSHFRRFFLDESKLKLGHAVSSDLRSICLALDIPKEVEHIVDTWQIFKGLHPEEKHSNLSHICRRVLGKEICKAQTLTNWRRRPLRRSQLHYAAMDAFVVLRIYDQWLKQYGEQYLMHFVEQEDIREQVGDA